MKSHLASLLTLVTHATIANLLPQSAVYADGAPLNQEAESGQDLCTPLIARVKPFTIQARVIDFGIALETKITY